MTRVKVTYIAIDTDGSKPLVSASTFEDLRKGLDEYYGLGGNDKNAKCLGFVPYQTKYPDDYEGYYEYEFSFNDEIIKDTVKVYCIEYYPHTTYGIEI